MGALWFPLPCLPVSNWRREPKSMGEKEGTQADSVALLVVEVNFGLRHQQQLLGISRVASLFL